MAWRNTFVKTKQRHRIDRVLPHTALPLEACLAILRSRQIPPAATGNPAFPRPAQPILLLQPFSFITKRNPTNSWEDMSYPTYLFLLLLPLLPPALSKTCCSSPKPSQPILCSSRNSCILRGLGNTSGFENERKVRKYSFFRDPRCGGGMPAYPGQQGQQGCKKYYRGEKSHQKIGRINKNSFF